MKTAASKVESMPCIIISGRGQERMIVTSEGNFSMSRLSPLPCESLTTICVAPASRAPAIAASASPVMNSRSEEHTSELQSLRHLVCRLLLEKKKKKKNKKHTST